MKKSCNKKEDSRETRRIRITFYFYVIHRYFLFLCFMAVPEKVVFLIFLVVRSKKGNLNVFAFSEDNKRTTNIRNTLILRGCLYKMYTKDSHSFIDPSLVLFSISIGHFFILLMNVYHQVLSFTPPIFQPSLLLLVHPPSFAKTHPNKKVCLGEIPLDDHSAEFSFKSFKPNLFQLC